MLLMALTLLPLVGLALFTAASERHAASRSAHRETLRLARLCAAHQERLLESSRQLLVTLAGIPAIRELDAKACTALFAQMREQYPFYANIGLLNARGDLIASALPAPPANFAYRTYFDRAIRTRKFAVGDFQVGVITHKPTINVALPLFGENEEPFAVIFAALELTWLEQMQQLANLPADSVLFVVDQTGTIVTGIPEAGKWTGRRFADSPAGRAVANSGKGEGVASGADAEGIDRIYAFTEINSGPSRSQAHIVVGISKEAAFRGAGETLRRHLIIIAVTLVVALAGAWFASDALILRRLKSLVAATGRVAAGDFSARAGVKDDGSELAELARAFDEMAVSLARRGSERAEAENALRQSEAMFRNLFESSPDAIFVEDTKGNVLDVNPAACRLHNRTRLELIGTNVLDLVPAASREEVLGTFHNWVAGEMVALESVSETRDGREINVGIRASRINFKGQDALLFHVRDITDRKRIEADLHRARAELELRVVERTSELASANAALRETSERFDLVLLGTNDGIWDWDLRTNEVYFSRRWKAMLGYGFDEISNDLKEWEKRLHPDERERALQTVRDYVEGKTPVYELEHRLLARDGSWRWILARGFALRDAAGKAYRLVGSHVDLTERMNAREELTLLAEELRRSNEELEQFAYVASHDLQEPLRMVASYTQLLERRYADKLDKDAQEFIHYAVDGAHRMQQFIRDLLEYSRVGTRGATFVEVSLDEIVDQTLALLRLSIEEKRAVITRSALPVVRGDAGQLLRLFQNLLSNAMKFCADREPRIEISAERADDGWRVAVKDNGIGIDPQYFERIFVIFQRLHARDEYSGTGIGLAICKKVVERHGGRIWVDSRAGEGTTFFFTLPGSPPGAERGSA